MADFSEQEKRNLSFKHVLGVAGTNNLDGANGRRWYEESISSTHPVYLPIARAEYVPTAINITQARSNAQSYGSVEDRSQGESVTLAANGSDWNITTTTIVPDVGYQITNTHPNPTYIKSITAVVDNGGGSYTITLSDNTGVSAGAAVLHSRLYLTKDPTSNQKTWMAKEGHGNHFSARIRDFFDPFAFGQGYTLNLFQNDGTQVQLTEGAWFFNWAEGLLVFADGFTASDLGYSEPLYVEGFRYSGDLGVSGVGIDVLQDGVPIASGITSFDLGEGLGVSGSGDTAIISVTGSFGADNVLDGANLYDTLFWNGTKWEPTGYLQISGSDVIVPDRLEVRGSIIIPSGSKPAETPAPGIEGEVRFDYNYMYIHTGLGGWRRTELAVFGHSPGSSPGLPPSFQLGLAGVVQCPVTTGTDLDVVQDPLPLGSPSVNKGSIFVATASGIQVLQQGICKVTWNVEGEKSGGSSQRRVLTTNVAVDGVDVPGSFSNGYLRDSTNNSTNSQNSILVEITAVNQTISIKSAQTGSGDPTSLSSFLSKGGHVLIELIGAT